MAIAITSSNPTAPGNAVEPRPPIMPLKVSVPKVDCSITIEASRQTSPISMIVIVFLAAAIALSLLCQNPMRR